MAGIWDDLVQALAAKKTTVPQPAAGVAPVPTPGSDGYVPIPAGGGAAPADGTIMGMQPASFAAFAGGLAAALAPENTWQKGLGTFAQGLGTEAMTTKSVGTPVKGAQLKKKEKTKSTLRVPDLKLDLSNTLLGR